MLNRAAHRLQAGRVAPCREAGQHALQRHAAQLVVAGKSVVRRHRQLLVAVSAAHPGARHGHTSTAERHAASFAAVPHRGAFRVVLALGPCERSDVLLEEGVHHLQASADSESQEPFLAGTDELLQRDDDVLGQLRRSAIGVFAERDDGTRRVVRSHVTVLRGSVVLKFPGVSATQRPRGGPSPQIPRRLGHARFWSLLRHATSQPG